MRSLVAIGLLLILGAPVLRAQTTPIRASDINAGAKSTWCPSGGWLAQAEGGGLLTVTRIANGFTTGEDSMRGVGIPIAVPGTQAGWGCRFPVESGSVTQGVTRYMRFRTKVNTPVRWLSSFLSEDKRSTVPEKVAEIATGGGATNSRMIVHFRADPAGVRDTPSVRFTKGTGGEAPADWVAFAVGRWVAMQFKVVSSSTVSAADGGTSLYLDNDTEATPDGSEIGQVISTRSWGLSGCSDCTIGIGDHSYNSLSNSSGSNNADVEFCCFEYDDAFDPNWAVPSGGGNGAVPSPPGNVRIVS